jgi:DNA-directed RNA polymerase subunit M/transcription elongation factor TFIIS
MNLKDFNCDKCGAYLELIDEKELVFECKHCGYQKKMNDNYIIKEYSTNGVVPIELEIKHKLKVADFLISNEKYIKAYEMFCELYSLNNKDVRILEGLMISWSHNFDLYKLYRNIKTFSSVYEEYLEQYNKYQTNKEKVLEFTSKYNDVINKYKMTQLIVFIVILGFILFDIIYMMIFF